MTGSLALSIFASSKGGWQALQQGDSCAASGLRVVGWSQPCGPLCCWPHPLVLLPAVPAFSVLTISSLLSLPPESQSSPPQVPRYPLSASQGPSTLGCSAHSPGLRAMGAVHPPGASQVSHAWSKSIPVCSAPFMVPLSQSSSRSCFLPLSLLSSLGLGPGTAPRRTWAWLASQGFSVAG